MIRSSPLNKFIHFIFFIYILIFNFTIAVAAVDIWKKKENEIEKKAEDERIEIESPKLPEDINKIVKVEKQGISAILDKDNSFNDKSDSWNPHLVFTPHKPTGF